MEIVEYGKLDRPRYWNSIFDSGCRLDVAADRDGTVDGDRDGDVTQRIVARLNGNGRAIGIGEREVGPHRNKCGRGCRTTVEATQFVIAAGIKAGEWRSHISAETLNVRKLYAIAKHVA